MTQICIPIQSAKLSELRTILRENGKKADIFEIWLDQIEGTWKPEEILTMTTKPVLFVNRGKREKGAWKGSEAKRIEALANCLRAGAKMIDIGIGTSPELIKRVMKAKKRSSEIIISYHHYTRTPTFTALWAKVQHAQKMGADRVKIVTYARTMEDNLTIVRLLLEAGKKKIPLIAHAMGKLGKLSRVLASSLDSSITYVALDERSRTAPGQLTVTEFQTLRSILNS